MSSSSFYKYCPIYQDKSFDNEYSVINLIGNQVTFSTRNNFNDLFDSKVDFIKPNKKALKQLSLKLGSSKRRRFKDVYFGDNWEQKINEFERELNNLFDRYLYYCVSDINNCNLMWSHYANSHKGFCIEWDATQIKAEKVFYEPEIASFRLIELIKMHCGLTGKDDISKKIWRALRTKLDEWEYESEYRFQLGNGMEHLIVKQEKNFALVKYESDWIKSIIWGCRTSDRTKKYIKENLSKHVVYRQAYPGKSSILIRDIE